MDPTVDTRPSPQPATHPGPRAPAPKPAPASAPLPPAPRQVHRLSVLASATVTPMMRRVTVAAPTIAGLPLRPAQDVALVFADAEGRELRRRYTITRVDPVAGTFALDGVLHGDGPGAAWFASVRPGDEIDAVGPRGRIEVVPDVIWHLLVADEAGLPALLELLAALPAGARATAVFEVDSPAEEQPWTSAATVDVHWVHRGGRPAGYPDLLTTALGRLAPAPDAPALATGPTASTTGPTASATGHTASGTVTSGRLVADTASRRAAPGRVQAYVLGESRAVVALNPALSALGVSRGNTFVKGYWNRPRGT